MTSPGAPPAASAPPAARRPRRLSPFGIEVAFAVLTGSLIATFVTWRVADTAVSDRARSLFLAEAHQIMSRMDKQVSLYVDALKGFQSLYAASKNVERDEFAAYHRALRVAERYPGFVAIQFVERVAAADVPALVERVRGDTSRQEGGYPDFRVFPEGEYAERFVITYLEPPDPTAAAHGFDVGSEPVRRAALERARDTGEPTATPRLQLIVDESRSPAFLVFLPVYRNGAPVDTMDDRRAALQGFVLGVFRAANMFTDLIGSEGIHPHILFQAFDGDVLSEESLLYGIYGTGRREVDPAAWYGGLEDLRTLSVGGRTWTTVLRGPRDFGLKTFERLLPLAALVLGVAFSLLLFSVLYTLSTSRAQALKLAGQMTEDLRSSESHFRSLIEHAQDLITILEPTGIIRYEGPSVTRLLGYGQQELIGQNAFSHMHPEDAPHALRALAEGVLVPGSTRSATFRFRHKNGSWRTLEAIGTNLLLNPSVRGIVVNSRDVTDREEAQRMIRESNERFRTLVANLPGAVYRCACDSEWTMQYLSDAIEPICGYPASDFIGNRVRSFASVIHPDDRMLVERVVLDAIVKREPYVLDYRMVHRDGSVRWVYEKGQGMFGPDGTVLHLDGAIFDVTDRKQVEQALLESGERMRAIVDTAQDAIISADRAGRVFSWNKGAEHVFGYAAAEMLSAPITRLMPERFRDAHQQGFLRFLATGEPHVIGKTVELVGLRKDGTEFPLEISLSTSSTQQHTFFTAIVRDIGGRKRAEQQLREAQAQLVQSEKLASIGRLAAGVAHEVKNPLAIVIQGINFLEAVPATQGPQEAEILQMMKKAITRADVIIRDLLDFARPTPLTLKRMSVAPVLDASLELVKTQLKRQNVQVTSQVEPDLPPVMIDEHQMRQVFINLIVNAFQAMPNGGDLFLRALAKPVTARELSAVRGGANGRWAPGQTAVVCEVEDTGIGIPAEALSKVTDPFFTTKPPGQGTGLGLSITQSILGSHQALLIIESAQGKGTKISILLPVAASETAHG